MRIFAIFIASILLITTPVFANNPTTLNAQSLAKSILDSHTYTGKKTGSFNIVYGGQDISRGNIDLQSSSIDQVSIG